MNESGTFIVRSREPVTMRPVCAEKAAALMASACPMSVFTSVAFKGSQILPVSTNENRKKKEKSIETKQTYIKNETKH
jgi:hypothetical protein